MQVSLCTWGSLFALLVSVQSVQAQGYPSPPPAPGRDPTACAAADLNRDARLSLEEFHHDIARGWHQLAPDAQGYVSLAQLRKLPGITPEMAQRLNQADRNRDGKLSFSEVVQARMAHFDAADIDGNDELSPQECAAGLRPRGPSR